MRRFWTCISGGVLLLALTAGPGHAAPPQLVDEADGARLQWLHKPNVAEIGKILGDYNVSEGSEASLECTIASNGRPRNCVVLWESPANKAMGKATAEVVALYKAASKDSLGRPVAGRKVVFGLKLGGWQ